jgi:hypothetical protein
MINSSKNYEDIENIINVPISTESKSAKCHQKITPATEASSTQFRAPLRNQTNAANHDHDYAECHHAKIPAAAESSRNQRILQWIQLRKPDFLSPTKLVFFLNN